MADMSSAKSTDWETHRLPETSVKIRLNREFSEEEMTRVRRGVIPEQMEDKWFIYWADDCLFFHRSWTGFCTYVVQFADGDRGAVMVSADVNRETDQYSETDDAVDAKMISYLIDVVLLHRDATFPEAEDLSPEEQAIKNWTEVGRAMLGDHPASSGETGSEP